MEREVRRIKSVCTEGWTDIKVEGLISRGGGKNITMEAAWIITTSLRWAEDGCVLNDISFFRCNLELTRSVSKFIASFKIGREGIATYVIGHCFMEGEYKVKFFQFENL